MPEGIIVSNRHLQLIDLLQRRGFMRVEELSSHLAVSPVTIRRDLLQLSTNGLIDRKHGGAAVSNLPQNGIPERNFEEKGVVNREEKGVIAERALELLHDNEIVFLNSGSTILHFLDAIQNRNLRVFTNNAWAVSCKKGPNLELMILGGEYREQSRSFVGGMTLDAISSIHSNITFLGTNGLSLTKGLTTAVHQECSVNQAMIRNTGGKIVVLADYSKIGKVSNFISSPLDSIDILVTDNKAPSDIVDDIRKKGIEVIVA